MPGASPMILMCDDQEMRPARARITGRVRGYPGDLAEDQWQVIAAHLPHQVPGRRGRPRIWPVRRIIEAICT